MNYEEKYRKLVDAIKEMRDVNPSDEGLQNWISDNVPELAESEDERIRKVLLEMFSNAGKNDWRGIPNEKVIAWLEKLGESDETKAKRFLINKGYPIDANGVFPTYEEIFNIIKEGLEKLGQKFNIGDWIVWKDKYYKVNYNGCGYELVDQNGLSTSLEYGTVDENAHLWTINDAKPGDVLVSEVCDAIVLFKGIKDNDIDFYCDYDFSEIDSEVDVTKDRFAINKGDEHYGSVEDAEDFHPATKEQRDTLMQAMTNAGWQFDFEKKELKKNDQNSAWSEDDERLRKTSIAFLQEFAAKGYENAVECMDWLKSLKKKIKNE